jgi:hypothetical protein
MENNKSDITNEITNDRQTQYIQITNKRINKYRKKEEITNYIHKYINNYRNTESKKASKQARHTYIQKDIKTKRKKYITNRNI